VKRQYISPSLGLFAFLNIVPIRRFRLHLAAPHFSSAHSMVSSMVSFVYLAAFLRLTVALPQAGLSSQTVSSVTETETSSTTISSPEDVPHATSLSEVAAVNVSISVDVSAELLNSIPLNADDPALSTEDPVGNSVFLSPADFLTEGLSIDDIPAVSTDEVDIVSRDLSALFGPSTRGPFANFLKVASHVFINAV
jgi:hypothetical protein